MPPCADCRRFSGPQARLPSPTGGRLPLRTWRLLRSVIQTTARRWRGPDHGIWEPRREMRHNVHWMEDGVGGPEGGFILCGFWLAEALALANRIEEAEDVFVAHAEASNHLGLLAEEIHPLTREQLGNFPQAFSHLGLISAAARIDRALRLRDEGSRSPRTCWSPSHPPLNDYRYQPVHRSGGCLV
ncbi:glycoside hydrolase family 15 protein [Corallococcus sicarius]|nr:glycoside hydrolase family 15 protein [Corallococcus sicarius]